MNDTSAYTMTEPERAEGTSSTAHIRTPPAESGHPFAARYTRHTARVRTLMTKPDAKVLRMYPPATSHLLRGVTAMSLSLPDTRSSIMVCSEPAEAVTGTMPSMPAMTHASMRSGIPSISG